MTYFQFGCSLDTVGNSFKAENNWHLKNTDNEIIQDPEPGGKYWLILDEGCVHILLFLWRFNLPWAEKKVEEAEEETVSLLTKFANMIIQKKTSLKSEWFARCIHLSKVDNIIHKQNKCICEI
jgi:hypothetical protein